jgi:type I restriction enzyme, S subunit
VSGASSGECSEGLRRYRAYPAYKNSGIEWLGEIPAHWEAFRFKLLFRDIYRYPTYYDIDYVPEGVAEVRGEALDDGRIIELPDQRYISVETSNRFPRTILREGDLVMSVRGTMGKIGLVQREFAGANITANLVRLSPRENLASGLYLTCLMRSELFLKALDKQAPQTTIQTITMPQLSSIVLPIPDLEEQLSIAVFLDKETAKIDALVAKKERLIELLQEKRSALITRAVTKGLDPNVPMKDPGVEGLGEIPAHWIVKRIRQCCSRVTDGAHISPDTSSADFPFVSTVDISGGSIDFNGSLRTSAISYAYMERTGCRPQRGDVLFSKDGTVGTTAVVKSDCEFAVASSLVILSPDMKQMEPRWLDYWLSSAFVRSNVELLLSGAALRRISVAKVGRLPLLLPPELSEQHKTADFLEAKTAVIDVLVEKVSDAIDRLKQLRTALISAAVTGKIDVREEAA